MIFTDIVRKVGRQFGDTDNVVIGTSGTITNDFYDWINEGQLIIAKKTECLVTSLVQAASTFPVTFPVDCIRTARVIYGTVPLERIDIEDLDAKAVDLTARLSNPQFFYDRLRKLNLYPLQNASDATSVTWDYVAAPTAIDNTTQTLSIPAIYHDELYRFCLSRAYERNENRIAAMDTMTDFKERMGDAAENEYTKDDGYPIRRDDPWEDW